MMRQELPDRDAVDALPPDGGPEFNRLIFEASPYLLQHARNPVDWWPWCDEAFERAREADLPVFLSVGYSTCHWCHVMERESFEDEKIARVLNESFVPIKVDREERPDVDEIYMNATQMLVGHAGWPNSVWLTPDRRPWYAGTYFPPRGRRGMPGFADLLRQLSEAWCERREEIESRANQVREAIAGSAVVRGGASVPVTAALLSGAVEALSDRFDERYGGFSDQPKFPPHAALRLLLHQHRRTSDRSAWEMVERTLDAMARGGLHDHVGGGFHRYCTDAWWLVPHFEKMLYDNGQLARIYALAFEQTSSREYEIAARGICDWVLREMVDDGGGFYAALDADSEGEEGKFYLWGYDEVSALLGGEAAALICELFNVRREGNFIDEATGQRSDRNILHLSRNGLPDEDLWPFVQRAKQQLLQERSGRVRPHLDDKVLAGWNGLMIGGMATAGRVFAESAYVEAATRAANFVLEAMTREQRLARSWRDGRLSGPGYLDDYAYVAEGLLDLHEATGDERWIEQAGGLADEMLRLFEDRRAGGFFFTAEDDEKLLARMKQPFDQSTPSGNGTAALVLARLHAATGEERYLHASERTLAAFSSAMQNAPAATETLLLAASRHIDMEAELAETPEAAQSQVQVPDARACRGVIAAEAWSSRRQARPADKVKIAVRVSIEDGWHVNANRPAQPDLVGTELELDNGHESYRLAAVEYAQASELRLDGFEDALRVHEGEFWVRAVIEVRPDAEDGNEPLRLSLSAQPCNDRECGRPERLCIELPMRVEREARSERRHAEVFERLAREAGQRADGR